MAVRGSRALAGFRRRARELPDLSGALVEEFGPRWETGIAERLLEAVWEGDVRVIDSDANRFVRKLQSCAPPPEDVAVKAMALTALYAEASRWSRFNPAADPHSDVLRYGEVNALMRERGELYAQAAAVPQLRAHPLAGRWVTSVASLIVRAVRFRDGSCLPELTRRLSSEVRSGRHGMGDYVTLEGYLAGVAAYANRVVNGRTQGANDAAGCMRLLQQRFGGDYPFATATETALRAIADGDAETLRELADLTAAAAEEEGSAVQVLHNLVLAGEKVLHV